MLDFLVLIYPWVKSLHIISVISWMAALLYLPRLLVYHAEQVGQSGATHDLFSTMEMKLMNIIMRNGMNATWVFGLCLVFTPGIVDWSMIWPWTKAISVISMTVFHTWLVARVKAFAKGENTLTGRQYRFLNELPAVLMIVIVCSVVVKF